MRSIFINAFRATALNIRANKQVFLMSVTTIAIAFSILGLFFLVFVNLNSLLSTWTQQVQLIVYLKDGISTTHTQSLQRMFDENPQVESAAFISREKAWESFKNTFAGKSGFVAGLEFNPLPASYNLKFKESSHRLGNIRQFAEALKDREGIESLEYGEKWISRFEKFMIFLRVFILAVGSILSIGLILIISNTIKLSIYSRQEEIELMLMIGATHRFIKVPLMLEGIVQGMAGVGIALGLIKVVHLYMKYQFQGSLESIFRGADLHFLSHPLLGSMVLASVFIGWIGSFISITQFLHSGGRR